MIELRQVMPTKLKNSIIEAAIIGFKTQKQRIDDQILELRSMLSNGAAPSTAITEAPFRRRRKMSTAARARIAAAQRLRWVKARGESAASVRTESPKPKRRLSAAAKAKLIANLKKARAAKAAKAQSAVAKRARPVRKASATVSF